MKYLQCGFTMVRIYQITNLPIFCCTSLDFLGYAHEVSKT